jgi:membrane peptidoglycan carboxypeptidase
MSDAPAQRTTTPKKTRKPGRLRRGWNRLTPRGKRVVRFGVAGLFLAFVALVGAVYAAARVPLPTDTDKAQATLIEFSDGSRLGQLSKENRVDIPLDTVPQHVRDAVLAAEDRGYYKHPGISVTGIMRAGFQDVFGHGAKQGGSTITQQYARNAYLNNHRTFARKFREAVIAVKLDRKYSKDQVLEWYLNTIYFGRGAYGVEAAARTYFNVPAQRLTLEQGAVLAALIRSPEGGDPAIAPNTAKRRWHAVLDGMVKTGKLSRADADKAQYPKIAPRRAAGAKATGGAGPMGYVIEAVRLELKRNGFSDAEIYTGGLRVRTTIDKKREAAAIAAVQGTLSDPATDPPAALVSVEPGTGKVVAMYGGRDYGGKGDKSFINYAVNPRAPGSSFKPFVLAAALDDGISLKSTFDGHSPQTFNNYPVSNFGNEQFGQIDLVTATAHSVNTVYVPLGLKVGIGKTIDMAHRLGIPKDVTCQANRDATLFLGTCDLRPADEAAAFAAVAAKGKAAGWHLVVSVRTAKGKKLYTAKADTTQALTEGQAADEVHALRAVVEEGTGRAARLDRPAAGKTGTTSDNTNAWFSGFVPQLETTVWMGYEPRDDGSGQAKIPPLRNLHGVGEVTGGTLPAKIWHDYMTTALQGVPVQDFPPPTFGGSASNASASATATPSSAPPTTTAPSVTITAPPSVTPSSGLPTVGPTKGTGSPSQSSSPTATPTTGAPKPSAASP